MDRNSAKNGGGGLFVNDEFDDHNIIFEISQLTFKNNNASIGGILFLATFNFYSNV